jgi:hypothetical protein
VVSFAPRPLYPKGKAPVNHWTGVYVGPRTVLDAVVKRKIPSPCRDSNPPDHPTRSPALYHWAIPAPIRLHGVFLMRGAPWWKDWFVAPTSGDSRHYKLSRTYRRPDRWLSHL